MNCRRLIPTRELNFVSNNTDAQGRWRVLTKDKAYVLTPVCNILARPVTQKPPAEKFDVYETEWGNPEHWPETGKDPSPQFMLSLAQKSPTTRKSKEPPVSRAALESIKYCAVFRSGKTTTNIYLSEFLADELTEEEKPKILNDKPRNRTTRFALRKTISEAIENSAAIKEIKTVVSQVASKKSQKSTAWHKAGGEATAKWKENPQDVIAMCRHARKFIKRDKKGSVVRGTLKTAVEQAKGWWTRNHTDPTARHWIEPFSTSTLERWILKDWRKSKH